MSDLGLSGFEFEPNVDFLPNETSDGPPPIIHEQHDSNNIVSQLQEEKSNLGGPDDDATVPMSIPESDARFNIIAQPNLGGNDDNSTEGMYVPDSDVRFNCLQRSHQFTAINHALEGADYNTPITREVIYTIGQSGFTHLYTNAKLVAELLGILEEVSFPVCLFQKV